MKIVFKGDLISTYAGELVQGITLSSLYDKWDTVNTALNKNTFGIEIKWQNTSVHVKNSEWNITENAKILMPL
jgi:hypothetical protein